MSSANLKKKLVAAKKKFSKAKKRADTEGYGGELPDSRYSTKLVDAHGPEESQSSGRLQFVMVFEILDGDYKGEKIYRYTGLESDDQMFYALRDLARFGYEIEDFDEIEEALAEIAKAQPEVLITAKTKGDFQNYYIGKVEGMEVEEGDEEEEEEDEEEVEEVEEEDDDIEEDDDDEEDDEEEEDDDEEEDEEEVEEDPEEEPEEEEEEEVDDEDAVELEEGSSVSFTAKGKEMTGLIVKVINDEKVKVKSDKDGKTYPVKVDNLQPYTPPPKKKKTVTRKSPAKKKTKKKASAKKTTKKKTTKKRR